LLLDEAPGHTAILSRALAAQLDIVFVWLPKQCSELNAMDQPWKELKGDLAANRQFRNIAEAVDYAERWVLKLTDNQALQKAGVCSKSYWLGHFEKFLATYLDLPQDFSINNHVYLKLNGF
jgi:hypothetical protein